jgi:hypothetical protein
MKKVQYTMQDIQQVNIEETWNLKHGDEYFTDDTRATIVPMKAIHLDGLLQVRKTVDFGQVNNYANAMTSGAKFPPVRVAKIPDKHHLTVIDGWHRLHAAQYLGVEALPVIIEEMSFRDAMGEAALANLTHGLPIKRSELRQAFGMFVRSGRNRKGKGKNISYMSYRELAQALQGAVKHTTLLNWMRKDFPKIANAMGGDDHGNSQAEPPRVDRQRAYISLAYEGIEQLGTHFKEVQCPTARYEIHQQALATLEDMKQFEMVKPAQPEF